MPQLSVDRFARNRPGQQLGSLGLRSREPSGALHRPVRPGRGHRHHGADDRAEARRSLAPAVHRRQPHRRGGHHRGRPHRQGGCGRIHDLPNLRVALGQCGDQPQASLRSHDRPAGHQPVASLFYAVYVHPGVPAKSIKELVAYSEANPGKLMFGSSGAGGLQHLYEVDQWYGIITSAKVPKPIVQKLREGIVEALKSPDVVEKMGAEGSTPVGSAPEQFNAHIKSEIEKWRKLVKEANIQLQQ